MDVEAGLAGIVEREVENLGFELVKIEAAARGRRRLLRLFIDRPDEGVTIDDCVAVTKAVGFVLEGETGPGGPYTLEVSSPGIDRPLTRRAHYERFIGREARVRVEEKAGRRHSLIGEIAGVDDDGVSLLVAGETVRVRWDDIREASLRGAEDLFGKSKPRTGKGGSGKRF